MAKLDEIFFGLEAPQADSLDQPIYSVVPLPGYNSYFLGRGRENHACLLISTEAPTSRNPPPIRLENLDVQFELRCSLQKVGEPVRDGTFTVVKCRSLEHEVIRYFLSICETVVRIVGADPTLRQVSTAVQHLAAILQKSRNPPTRSVNGLFGELLLIWLSANPVRAMKAWRIEESARFDFIDGDARIDVKTTASRLRSHIFSYDQCNPPTHAIAIVASLFVERIARGMRLGDLVDEVESKISANTDLVLKLHEVVASTLGTKLPEALSISFDRKLAETSIRYFDLFSIPAIREELPLGVADVHFRSDVSTVEDTTVHELSDRDPVFLDLLPPSETVV